MGRIGAVVAVALVAGCVTTGGKRSTSNVQRSTLAVPAPGGGHALVTGIKPEPAFRAAAARLATYQWRFDLPQGTVPSNYWWTVLRSTNGRSWSIMYSNVSEIPIIPTDKAMEFFRLTGRP